MRNPIATSRLPPEPERAGFLALILMTGPVAWSLDLILKFALASNACVNPASSERWVYQNWLFVVIDAVAIAATAAATWLAFRSWNATARDDADHFHEVTEVGESRQHFLALWGMLIGAMFLSAIVYSFVVELVVSSCVS